MALNIRVTSINDSKMHMVNLDQVMVVTPFRVAGKNDWATRFTFTNGTFLETALTLDEIDALEAQARVEKF